MLLLFFTALRKLRGVSDVSDEIDEMRIEATKSVEKPFKVKELLVSPVHRIPILVACMMMVFQQWSGINAVSTLRLIDQCSKPSSGPVLLLV